METGAIDQLDREDRLRLVKFVCSFAWADLAIHPEERAFVDHIVQSLKLSDEDQSKVAGWLAVPPNPESIDPMRIPLAQRQLFLDSIEGVIAADGQVSPEERENLALLRELLV
ncbi:MAG: TerB family tellurite resistance protein [Deltaproteobacteria bacterium]|nr:TerB family tellurite resistance protein [Deltaproteobacteria bacterium]MBW2542960.1 TerB family tellurite resistance protein [Deltaproteobacteria bacterium]